MGLKKMLITGVLLVSLGTATGAYAATSDASVNKPAAADHQHNAMKHHKHGMHRHGLMKDAAGILKISKKTLIDELKAGKSLAEIASSKGISKQTLVTKLNASMKTHLDKAVANGKLTAAKEKKILSKSQERISKMVDHKGLGAKRHLGMDKNCRSQAK